MLTNNAYKSRAMQFSVSLPSFWHFCAILHFISQRDRFEKLNFRLIKSLAQRTATRLPRMCYPKCNVEFCQPSMLEHIF